MIKPQIENEISKRYNSHHTTIINDITLLNGDHYIGPISASLFNGLGFIEHLDGSKFKGFFKNGKRNGFGISFLNNRTKIEGNYIDDKKTGTFIITYPDGSKSFEFFKS